MKARIPLVGGGQPTMLVDDLLTKVSVPAEETSPGKAGQYAVTPEFLYLCVAPNTWARFASASWTEEEIPEPEVVPEGE